MREGGVLVSVSESINNILCVPAIVGLKVGLVVGETVGPASAAHKGKAKARAEVKATFESQYGKRKVQNIKDVSGSFSRCKIFVLHVK